MASVLIPKTAPIPKPPLDPASTVEQRMTGLLSKNNPYLQQAETYGKQEANAKGLLNSSMGIEAAESARIRAALPIAQQDAKTVADSALSNQNYKQTQAQLGYQGEISSALQGQQDDAALVRQDRQDDAALIRQTKQDDAALSREKLSQEATTARLNLENESKLKLATVQLQQEDQKALQGTLASIGQQYEREYSAILTDTSFTTPADRTAALTKLAAVYKSNANLAASVAGVSLQWS